MRALVITAPGHAEIQDVPKPQPGPDDVVIDVQRAGICGTDIEFFTGEMQYLHSGLASFPIRIGHEWMGTVREVGTNVPNSWLGRRVTGDTMLGCGACARCAAGRQHVCEFRAELGIQGGWAGALADQVVIPARALHALPDEIDDAVGALVEPGGNAFRAVQGADVQAGERLLVLGAGTIGILCAMFARAAGVEVHLLGRSPRSLEFSRSLGFTDVWSRESLPSGPWHGVIDASNDAAMPALAVELAEPGRHVAYVGLSGSPSLIDTRDLALNDVTAIGVLSASPGLPGTIEAYAKGDVDPRPLVAATVALEDLPAVLAGARPSQAGSGPKFHVAI